MSKVDARGLACPAPVLATKAAIESEHPERLEVLVDNDPSRENVTRFLASQGYTSAVEQEGEVYTITATRGSDAPQAEPAAEAPEGAPTKIMVMVASDCMGTGGRCTGRQTDDQLHQDAQGDG